MALWTDRPRQTFAASGQSQSALTTASQPFLAGVLFHCPTRQSIRYSLWACGESKSAGIYRRFAATVLGSLDFSRLPIHIERKGSGNSAPRLHQHPSCTVAPIQGYDAYVLAAISWRTAVRCDHSLYGCQGG